MQRHLNKGYSSKAAGDSAKASDERQKRVGKEEQEEVTWQRTLGRGDQGKRERRKVIQERRMRKEEQVRGLGRQELVEKTRRKSLLKAT